MMKTWQYITAAALIVGAFFFGLIASCSYFKSNPEIEIKWLTKTETVYTGNPQSLGDYERCYKSPLTIFYFSRYFHSAGVLINRSGFHSAA